MGFEHSQRGDSERGQLCHRPVRIVLHQHRPMVKRAQHQHPHTVAVARNLACGDVGHCIAVATPAYSDKRHAAGAKRLEAMTSSLRARQNQKKKQAPVSRDPAEGAPPPPF